MHIMCHIKRPESVKVALQQDTILANTDMGGMNNLIAAIKKTHT